jgi:diguanylate cyclase (GGDEF)-like protein
MRVTIRRKFSIVFVLLIVLPALLLGVNALVIVRQWMIEQAEREQLLLLQSVKTNVVDRHVEDMEKTLRSLAEEPRLLTVFDNADDRAWVRAQWELIRNVFPERSWIYFGTPQNQIIVSPRWEPPEGYDCRTRPWYRKARYADDVVWVDPYGEYITADVMMSAAVPVHDQSQTFRGVLSMDMHMEAFLALLRQEAGSRSPQIAAVSAGGSVLMLNEKETSLLDMASLPQWSTVRSVRDAGTYLRYNETDYYATFVDVPKLRLKLVSLLPTRAIYDDINPIVWTIVATSASFLVAALLAWLYFTRHFIANFERLNRYMSAVESGDYRIQYCVSGHDEFYDLNRRLNTMVHHLAESIKSLEDQSNTDALCQVRNRRYLLDWLREYAAAKQPADAKLCVALFDVDHFKMVNDSYGHATGDEVLRRLAGLMQSSFPEDAIVGRYGGEEFMAILPGVSANRATDLADAFRQKVERQSWRERDLVVTVSGGVTDYRESDQAEGMIHRADQALYCAKRQGRNQVIATRQHPPDA